MRSEIDAAILKRDVEKGNAIFFLDGWHRKFESIRTCVLESDNEPDRRRRSVGVEGWADRPPLNAKGLGAGGPDSAAAPALRPS
jgi:hypothetical protein